MYKFMPEPESSPTSVRMANLLTSLPNDDDLELSYRYVYCDLSVIVIVHRYKSLDYFSLAMYSDMITSHMISHLYNHLIYFSLSLQ
jgi:hypothetical protein